MGFNQNDRGKRYITNKIKILTKRGTDTIHAVIPMKYQKYTSTTILKYVNVLAKVNKLPWERLHNMIPQDACSIPIHVCTVILADISHEQKE